MNRSYIILGIVGFIGIIIIGILIFFLFFSATPTPSPQPDPPPPGPPAIPPDLTMCLSTTSDSLGGGAEITFSRVTVGSVCQSQSPNWDQVLVFQVYSSQVPGTTPYCISTTQGAAVNREIYLVNPNTCLSSQNQVIAYFPTSAQFASGLVPLYIYRTITRGNSYYFWSLQSIDTRGTALTLVYTVYVFPSG